MADENHLLAASLVSESPAVSQASMRLRTNYAVPNLLAAAMFSRRVGKIEADHQPFGPFWDEIQAHSIACVFLAVAGLESYANELFADRKSNFPAIEEKLLERIWAAFEEKTVLDKYDLALLLRSASAMDRGIEPCQSIGALVKLRNALIHFKPEWDDEQIEHKKLSDRLSAYFSPSPFLQGDTGLFPRAWATNECTRWAVSSSLKFLASFEDKAGLPHKMADFQDRLIP